MKTRVYPLVALALTAVTVLCALLVVGCATQPSSSRPSPAAVAPVASAGDEVAHMPRYTVPNDRLWYPVSALQRHLTGRVLVAFHVGPPGKTLSPSVAQSDADPALQQAALQVVSAMRFDLKDSRYDGGAGPFRILVTFCIDRCAGLKPYSAGPYPTEELVITVPRHP
jgi:TonB family protein